MKLRNKLFLSSFAASAFLMSQTAQAEMLKTRNLPLLGKGIFTEGIAHSQKRNTFYVGSAVGGAIQKVNQEGQVSWVQQDGTDGRSKALGLQVDDARDRLWVVGHDAVYIYQLSTNTLLRKNPVSALGEFGSSFLNDLALTKEGDAFVTDSFSSNIFKVDGKTLKMQHFTKAEQVKFGSVNGSPWNFNGVVVTPDQKSLIVGKTNDGSLWKMTIATKKWTALSLSEPVTYVDGLEWGANGNLYIMRNFENKISHITYSEKKKSFRVEDLQIDKKAFKIPTTAVFIPGSDPKLIVVNSQFEQVPTPSFLTEVSL